jgi:DNA-binding beta-propeller fold protein YncE
LLVNSPGGQAVLFNLRTADRTALPASAQSPEADHWVASADGHKALRWNTADWRSEIPVSFFDGTSLASSGNDLLLPTRITSPLLSSDGAKILTFWQPGTEDQRLTIFDAASAQPLKQGSQLDGESVTAKVAAWLPDGRYIYMSGATLYVSSPGSNSSQQVATLDLPSNNEIEGGGYVAGQSDIAVSPDGRQIAFTWHERRSASTFDTNIWVVNVDGTSLHRLTSAPDTNSPISFTYGSPTWSPDGRWIAGVLFMGGTVAAPVYPDEPFLGSRVVGTTGCGSSPVFVLPSDAQNVAVSWPRIDRTRTVKVKSADGSGGEWVTSCATIQWLP